MQGSGAKLKVVTAAHLAAVLLASVVLHSDCLNLTDKVEMQGSVGHAEGNDSGSPCSCASWICCVAQ